MPQCDLHLLVRPRCETPTWLRHPAPRGACAVKPPLRVGLTPVIFRPLRADEGSFASPAGSRCKFAALVPLLCGTRLNGACFFRAGAPLFRRPWQERLIFCLAKPWLTVSPSDRLSLVATETLAARATAQKKRGPCQDTLLVVPQPFVSQCRHLAQNDSRPASLSSACAVLLNCRRRTTILTIHRPSRLVIPRHRSDQARPSIPKVMQGDESSAAKAATLRGFCALLKSTRSVAFFHDPDGPVAHVAFCG